MQPNIFGVEPGWSTATGVFGRRLPATNTKKTASGHDLSQGRADIHILIKDTQLDESIRVCVCVSACVSMEIPMRHRTMYKNKMQDVFMAVRCRIELNRRNALFNNVFWIINVARFHTHRMRFYAFVIYIRLLLYVYKFCHVSISVNFRIGDK